MQEAFFRTVQAAKAKAQDVAHQASDVASAAAKRAVEAAGAGDKLDDDELPELRRTSGSTATFADLG